MFTTNFGASVIDTVMDCDTIYRIVMWQFLDLSWHVEICDRNRSLEVRNWANITLSKFAYGLINSLRNDFQDTCRNIYH